MTVFLVQNIEIPQGRFRIRQIEGLLAARAADVVDDLVLEDPHQPGAHGGPPGETLCALDGRHQRLLDSVLGLRLVSQLQHREPEQHRPMLLEVKSFVRSPSGTNHEVAGPVREVPGNLAFFPSRGKSS